MVELWERKPVVKFLGEVILMVLIAAILVWILGLIQDWSHSVDYSNGFFFASVVLAAISSSLAILRRPGPIKENDLEAPKIKQEQEFASNTDRFFATRSSNFRMLVSSLICLIISILIAQ